MLAPKTKGTMALELRTIGPVCKVPGNQPWGANRSMRHAPKEEFHVRDTRSHPPPPFFLKKYKWSSCHVKCLGISCLMTMQFGYQNVYSWICEILLSKICAQGTYLVNKISWPVFFLGNTREQNITPRNHYAQESSFGKHLVRASPGQTWH